MRRWDKVVRQTVKASSVNTIHVHGGVSRYERALRQVNQDADGDGNWALNDERTERALGG